MQVFSFSSSTFAKLASVFFEIQKAAFSFHNLSFVTGCEWWSGSLFRQAQETRSLPFTTVRTYYVLVLTENCKVVADGCLDSFQPSPSSLGFLREAKDVLFSFAWYENYTKLKGDPHVCFSVFYVHVFLVSGSTKSLSNKVGRAQFSSSFHGDHHHHYRMQLWTSNLDSLWCRSLNKIHSKGMHERKLASKLSCWENE